MKTSPLQFAKEFARLKSDLSRLSVPDLQLLRLIEFWPQLESHVDDVGYHTYVDEYIPLFCRLVTEQALFDLSIGDLAQIRDTLNILAKSANDDAGRGRIDRKLRLVTFRLAVVLFYVGDIEQAIPLCAELCGEKDFATPDTAEEEGLDAFDTLRVLADKYNNDHPDVGQVLKDIFERWEAERACVHNDRAWCLFVEKNQGGGGTRGRLRQLQGTVEIRRPTKKGDEDPDTVTFDNQIRTPDDPFVGVTYDSLKAVRNFLPATRFAGKPVGPYHSFFTVVDSQGTFTGDSIGLATGLITYAQLLKPEIMRQEKFIASEVAFTGGLDTKGRLLPINKGTLAPKIERAFFSPLKYLVLAEECLPDAGPHLAQLSGQYPRRNLILIGHQRLNNVIENHNIIRSEKVCMGAFITRKAAKYSRGAKVQVPLLAALLWALLAVLFPKVFNPWFDHNPVYVQASNTGFTVSNADSVYLWSVTYECGNIDPLSRFSVCDLNNDGDNEVLLVPEALDNELCESSAHLYAYDQKGSLLFKKECAIPGEYPGDTLPSHAYNISAAETKTIEGRTIIMTQAYHSHPARSHLRFRDSTGAMLGWFINPGHMGAYGHNFACDGKSRFLFLGYNNPMACVSLFVLDPDSSYGVAPPYDFPEGASEHIKRGNQICYILFPRSDLNYATHSLYNVPKRIVIDSQNIIMADVYEDYSSLRADLSYFFDDNLRIQEVRAGDEFILLRNELVEDGRLPTVDWDTYLRQLRDSVMYWMDSCWVTEAELQAVE